jgi:hypothetical protein
LGANATLIILVLYYFPKGNPNEEYMKYGRMPYANGFTSQFVATKVTNLRRKKCWTCVGFTPSVSLETKAVSGA